MRTELCIRALSRSLSMGMRLVWIANTCSDCLFETTQLAQVTAERYKKDKVKILRRLNKAVKVVVDNPLALKLPRHNLDCLRFFGFSEASLESNNDLVTPFYGTVLQCVGALFSVPHNRFQICTRLEHITQSAVIRRARAAHCGREYTHRHASAGVARKPSKSWQNVGRTVGKSHGTLNVVMIQRVIIGGSA